MKRYKPLNANGVTEKRLDIGCKTYISWQMSYLKRYAKRAGEDKESW
ncbi:hypothetical protein [Schaedlerella arabinosiphila]|nr:hypothetical protein [Schaedlerella arabinosiphila]